MSACGEEFAFALATREDEPEIRRLVGAIPMPGSVTFRFEREPDYFLGCDVMGDTCDVLICRHLRDGVLAGVLCRSERDLLVNGSVQRVGSIGQVRGDPRFRGRWLMHRGLPLLRARSAPDLLYAGVVARDNPRARAVMLERRPPGGLHARRISGITTHALLLRARQGPWRRRDLPSGVEIRACRWDDLDALVAFLRRAGASRQLFPAWRVEDFTEGRTTRALEPSDIGLAWRGPRLVGALAMWDQCGFKQDVVHAYGPALRRLRPAWGYLARLAGAPRLPVEGTMLPLAFAALPCVAEDDRAVMRALLEWVASQAARQGVEFLLLGLCDGDPLGAAVGRWPRITYRSDLFAFSWTDTHPGAAFDGRIPHVEIATL